MGRKSKIKYNGPEIADGGIGFGDTTNVKMQPEAK